MLKKFTILLLTISFGLISYVEAKQHHTNKHNRPNRPHNTNNHKPHKPHGKHNNRPHHHKNNEYIGSGGGDAMGVVVVSLSTSLTTYSLYTLLTDDEKVILPHMKEEAALFIASNGQLKGAYLESTLNRLRADHKLTLSDEILAQAILTSDH